MERTDGTDEMGPDGTPRNGGVPKGACRGTTDIGWRRAAQTVRRVAGSALSVGGALVLLAGTTAGGPRGASLVSAPVSAPPASCSVAADGTSTCSVTLAAIGSAETWTVPSGATDLAITLSGAAGGTSCDGVAGGEGGSIVVSHLPAAVTAAGTPYVFEVGSQPAACGQSGGWPDGGAAGSTAAGYTPTAGAGGGSTSVVIGAGADAPGFVAGGGGGAGGAGGVFPLSLAGQLGSGAAGHPEPAESASGDLAAGSATENPGGAGGAGGAAAAGQGLPATSPLGSGGAGGAAGTALAPGRGGAAGSSSSEFSPQGVGTGGAAGSAAVAAASTALGGSGGEGGVLGTAGGESGSGALSTAGGESGSAESGTFFYPLQSVAAGSGGGGGGGLTGGGGGGGGGVEPSETEPEIVGGGGGGGGGGASTPEDGAPLGASVVSDPGSHVGDGSAVISYQLAASTTPTTPTTTVPPATVPAASAPTAPAATPQSQAAPAPVVTVPATDTGQPWSGWTWWVGVVAIGLGGCLLLLLPRWRRAKNDARAGS